MLGRLSEDWQQRWGHPVAMVESFVDPQLFQGTAYKVSGWSKLGATSGFARTGQGTPAPAPLDGESELAGLALCCTSQLRHGWFSMSRSYNFV